METDGATVNGDQMTSNIIRPIEHKVKDVIQAHGVVKEIACPPEAQLEAVATEMKNQEPADALLSLEVMPCLSFVIWTALSRLKIFKSHIIDFLGTYVISFMHAAKSFLKAINPIDG